MKTIIKIGAGLLIFGLLIAFAGAAFIRANAHKPEVVTSATSIAASTSTNSSASASVQNGGAVASPSTQK
jgi:hypothetical protein